MHASVESRDAQVLRAFVERVDQTDPRAFNNLGVLYHSKGMHSEAVDAFLRAISLDPRMQTAMRNLEVAAAVDGACDVRLAELTERSIRNPDDRVTARELARLLRLIGRQVEATQRLDALIAEDPDDAPSLLERGMLEQRNGDLRKAQRWFERASNADETNVMSRLHLAEVLYQRGQNEQALEALDLLLLLDDEVADAHLLRGFVLGDMGRHEAGMEAARRASALNPSLSTAQANLSLEKVLSSGSFPVIELNGAPALTVVPSGEMAHYSLGLAFRQRGYFAEARQEFERALQQREDERVVRHAIAELDLIDGNFVLAAKGYESLLHTYGENARWRNEHGVAMHQSGAVQLAAESYRCSLRSDPRYAWAYANLGVALADMSESSAAREALQQAASIDPTLVRARLNLARLHAHQGNSLGALSLLRELSAFHGTDAEVWYDMGTVLVTLQRTDEARRAFLSAIEHRADHEGARYALAQMPHDPCNADDAESGPQEALNLSRLSFQGRLTLSIELQQECPDAVGSLDLLAFRFEQPVPAAANDATETYDDHLRDADAFAARSLHGEALERYASMRRQTEYAGPKSVWRRSSLGEARSKCLLGRGGEALDLLEKLLHESSATNDDEAETLALLAAAHAAEWHDHTVEPRRARAAIARFLRLETRSAALLHFVGNVAVSLREDALALVLFRRALAVDPMRPTPRVAIARLLRLRNDVLAARLELVAALAVAPLLRDALLELARLYCSTDRSQDALGILVTHLNRTPADTDALVLLASALLQGGREHDARLALARALRHSPGHEEAGRLQAKLLREPRNTTVRVNQSQLANVVSSA